MFELSSQLSGGHVGGKHVGLPLPVVVGLVCLSCGGPDTGGIIKGTLIASPDFVAEDQTVPLPDLTVIARDPATAAEVARVESDLDGRFALPLLDPGSYEVCWEGADWVAACHPDLVAVASMNVGLGLLEVVPDAGRGKRAVHGQVRLADGTLCVYRNGEPALRDVAVITAVDGGGQALGASIRTNRQGSFVLVVDPGAAGLHARCGNSGGAAALGQAGAGALALEIADHRPQIVNMGVFRGGQMIRSSNAGTSVELRIEARDEDGDALEASWSVTGGTVTPISDLSASWRLPLVEGTYIASAAVGTRGARGGGPRAEEVIYFRVGPAVEHFAGTVRSDEGGLLNGLEVTVDGAGLSVGVGGRFFGSLPPDPDGTYVLNIRADGHVPVSEVLDHGTLAAVYTLQRATQTTFPAGQDVTLQTDDRKGVATIQIRGESLVKLSDGSPAAGDVRATYAYLDPAVQPLPGDYAATTARGVEAYLDSYGAVFVGLETGAGEPLQLAPGNSARVTFPVPPGLAASPPPSIPIWSYDDKAGTWREERGAVATLGASGYTATVTHFSFVNMDIAVDEAACLRVKPVFQQLPAPSPRLRVTAPQQNGDPKTKILALDDPINVVFRLLPNQPVQLEVLNQDDEVFADLRVTDDAGVPLVASAVDPGGDITGDYDPSTWDGQYRPPEPYKECRQTVVLISANATYQGANSFGFLAYEGADAVVDADCSDGSCDDGALEAEAYYKLVDPEDLRLTLGGWWEANGFDPVSGLSLDPDNDDVVEAAYLNAGDLGSGRNMRCRTTADRVACYVGNYGAFDLQPGNADLAEDANQADAFATVCMEYAAVENGPDDFLNLSGAENDPIDGEDKVVKFFVYFGGDAGSPRVNAARLDNTYARYNPRICMSCHGGELPSQLADAVLAADNSLDMSGVEELAALQYMNENLAVFREFDVASFGAPTNGFDDAAFKALNCDIITQTPLPDAVTELVNGWHNCASTVDDSFDDTFVPAGWSGTDQTALYEDVVAGTCRACHVAQERDGSNDDDPDNDLDFNRYQDWDGMGLDFVKFVICDGYYMPHAEVTFNKLWFTLTPQGAGVETMVTNGLTSSVFAGCSFTQ